jgi:predicted HTH transcriptional regulator
MLTATDALALVHAELGEPPITVLDPAAGPRALRRAVADAARDPEGGLLAVLAADAAALTLPRTWLATGPRAELHTMPVEEGVLLLARVPGTGQRAVAERARPVAWATADATPVTGATEDDLDDDGVRRLLEKVDERCPATHGSNTERYLGRRGILALDGRRWRPTVAAMLVAGLRPELFVPGCAVELEVDGEGRELRGTVPELVRRFGEGLVACVDADLLAEVVLNALLHRDWSVEVPVRVGLSGERLVVTSPGALPTGAPRRAVHPNPLLLHFAEALGLTSGAGRGLRDVARRLEAIRRRPFSLVERQGEVWFVADVRRARERRAAPRNPEPAQVTSPPLVTASSATTPAPSPEPVPATSLAIAPPAPTPPPTESSYRPAPAPAAAVASPPAAIPVLLPRDPDDRAAAVLAALRAQGQATTRELAAALGCSRPVVGKVLTALVAEGRVRPTVSAGRSPFQSYEVVEDRAAG